MIYAGLARRAALGHSPLHIPRYRLWRRACAAIPANQVPGFSRLKSTNGNSSNSSYSAFLWREAKLFAGLAVLGGIGGTVYFYGYRKNLPAKVYNGILTAQARMDEGKFDAALVELTTAKNVVENGEFSEESSEYIHFLLGQCHSQLGSPAAAKESFERALALLDRPNAKHSKKRQKILMSAYNGIGSAAYELGEVREAEGYYLKALNVTASPAVIADLFEEVNNIVPLAQLVDMEDHLDSAVSRIGEEPKFEDLAEFSVELAGTLNNLGALFVETNRWKQAVPLYLRSLALLVVFGHNASPQAQQCREVLHTLRSFAEDQM